MDPSLSTLQTFRRSRRTGIHTDQAVFLESTSGGVVEMSSYPPMPDAADIFIRNLNAAQKALNQERDF